MRLGARPWLHVVYLYGTLAALVFTEGALLASPIQVVSGRNPLVPVPSVPNSDSVDPQLTPDGRFVLFTSSATDLTTNVGGLFVLNLFLTDNASNRVSLVSANLSGSGGNGNSLSGMVSTNGRYVVFQSDASDLVWGDTNGVTDIFLRDVVLGTTTLVSITPDGGVGSGASTDPKVTPDGRFVVFLSAATNLVPNDTNGITDVFVRDTWSNTTVLVSVGASGANATMASPLITPDGGRVAFFSTASNLVAGVPPLSHGEIYVRDLVEDTTTWASTNVANVASNLFQLGYMPSYHPCLSADGTVVAFKTGWTNGATLPRSPGQPGALVFRFDLTNGSSTLVSTDAFPRWAYSDDIYGPEITPDGRFIAFVATNSPPIASLSIVLWDVQTGASTIVNAAPDGSLPTNTLSSTPIVSPDGRFVAFLSTATNLVANTVSNGWHIYLRDLQANSTQLVDADAQGIGSADESGVVPSLAASGDLVAFCAADDQFAPGQNANDVFLRDIADQATQLVSRRQPHAVPQTGSGTSLLEPLSISADGRWVVFSSFASDLVTNDFNDNPDVFLADLQNGTNLLLSVGLDGNAAAGQSFAPVISADGRFVAFVSTATNLVANQTNQAANIFLRDLQAGTTAAISVDQAGSALGTGDASAPVISGNGWYLAFLCQTNPAAPGASTFWRDLVAGTTVLLSPISSTAPSMSADGQRVAWFDGLSQLHVWDAQSAITIYTNSTNTTFASLAPPGNRLLWMTTNSVALVVVDLPSGSNLFWISTQSSSPMPRQGAELWSADGRFITFATTASLVPQDTNGISDVYLYDFQTSMTTLISANSDWSSGANGPSDIPAISGDGRFITFRSFATDIVSGATNSPGLFVFDRTTGATSLLLTGSPGSWTSWASQPIASGNGASLVFQSWDSGIVAGDFNRAQDIFAQSQAALIVDSDHDGIPDWWMMQYFGHPTGLASDLSRAQDDADGNGMSNLQKYLTGINPRDPKAVFALQVSQIDSSSGTVKLTWPGVPGKSYLVQYIDDLSSSPWQVFVGNILVLGTQGSTRVPASPVQRFYRVVCVN